MELVTAFITKNIIFILLSILILIINIIIFLLPITIANKKNIKGEDYTKIKVLTWLGLLGGFPWFIALFLSLYYKRRV